MPAPVTIYDKDGNKVKEVPAELFGPRCGCGVPPGKNHRCTDVRPRKRNPAGYAPRGNGVEGRFKR